MTLTRFVPGREVLDRGPATARPTNGRAQVSIVAVESARTTNQTVDVSARGALVSSAGGLTVIVRVGSAHYRCQLRRAFETTGGRTAYAVDIEEPCDMSPPFASMPVAPLDEPSLHASLAHSLEQMSGSPGSA